MNIEDSIKTLKKFNKIKINSYAMQFVNISYPDLQEAIETLLIAYEKQNKIIDLMANDLKTPINSKEWIIEYYKKRCEDAKD